MAKTKSVARASRREANRPIPNKPTLDSNFNDSFQNFAARLGQGTDNQASYGTMGFNPITRNRVLLDWSFRGSWICRKAITLIPEDMTRAGFDLGSDISPDDSDLIHTAFNQKFELWPKLCEAMMWARLYGGAIAVMLIDGHKMSDPLIPDRIAKDSFCGLGVIDRWMLMPSSNDLVTDLRSKDLGKPKYYTVNADAPLCAREKIHHTRILRFEGEFLPYYQKLGEDLWGMSVLEPIWDRVLAFDSTTTGSAQLVYRAHMRSLYIKNLRELIGTGGKLLEAVFQQVDWMRRFQGNEGLTLMDAEDKFESSQYNFGGLDSVLIQMGQQLSGAIDIPLVKLFGQSPVGLNSTGESDTRNYYDGISTRQNKDLKPGLERLLLVTAKSEGVKLPDNFNFSFAPLWQMDYPQKAAVASGITSSVLQAFAEQLIDKPTALKELRSISKSTGVWTNITDEDIEAAENEPPMPRLNEPPGLEQFLPGNNEQQLSPPQDSEDEESENENISFLPGRRKLKSIFAKRKNNGELIFGELERSDKKNNPPLVHLHLQDKDQRGRELLFNNIPITIEVERGLPRHVGSSGGSIMAAPYGYVQGTEGLDGDSVDVFIGPNENSKTVFIILQQDPDTKELHQHKCFLGFDKLDDAVKVFTSFYADGRGGERLQDVITMSIDQFKNWLKDYEKKVA